MSGLVGWTMIAAFTAVTVGAMPGARADRRTDRHAEGETPWSAGVSKSHQKQAFELFDAGNALFEEGKYTDALAEYEKAIRKWDHPSIELNIAICLINIRQPLDAWDHLEQALRYGEAPFDKRVYEQALTNKALLESTLAQLEVSSEQEGVQVMLDGRELFTGKADKTVHLLAGKHELVATRDGYQTESRALDLPAGHASHEAIELEPEKVKVTVTRENYERRWTWWIPWTTSASGVALALIGTGVYLAARSDMKSYDTALAAQCPMGCTANEIPSSLHAREVHAQHVSEVGIGFWGAGAAVAVAAGVMAVLNRPQLVDREGHPELAIIATPSYVGASIGLTFR